MVERLTVVKTVINRPPSSNLGGEIFIAIICDRTRIRHRCLYIFIYNNNEVVNVNIINNDSINIKIPISVSDAFFTFCKFDAASI